MVRLYLFAEGQTEQTFADEVLSPHLAAHQIYLGHSPLIAHARRKGRVHRGGGRRYGPMRNDILRFTKQERSAEVFFTTMIDLYALPNDFPGRGEAEQLRRSPSERVEALERSFAEDIGDSRFVPYIQLHEFEAILFSEPSAFGYYYDRADRMIASLQAIANRYDSPENIDDGMQTAPSKRIIQVFKDYKGAKTTAGPIIAMQIGLVRIREKCPHFNNWLTKLEGLSSTKPML